MRTILILFLCCFLWIGCNESTKVNDDPPKTEQQESIQKQSGWMDDYKIPMLLCGLIVIVVIVLIKIYNEGDDSSCSRSRDKCNGDIVDNNRIGFLNSENDILKTVNQEKEIKDPLKTYEDRVEKLEDRVEKLEDRVKKLEDGVKKLEDGVKKLEDGVKKLQDGVISTNEQEGNTSVIQYFGSPIKNSNKSYFDKVYNDIRGRVKFEVKITGKMGKYKPIDISRLKGCDVLGVAIFCKEGSCFYSEANSFRIIEEGEVHFEGEKGAGGEEGIWVIDKRVAITLIR